MTDDTRLAHLLKRLVDVSFRRPWLLVAIFVLVGAGAAYKSSQLGFRGDFIELLPESSAEVKDLRFVEARAGGGGYLVTQVTGGTPERRRAFANAFAPKMEESKELVRYVEYRFDIGFFRSRALLLLPTEKLKALTQDLDQRIQFETVSANPLYVKLTDDPDPPTFAEIEKKYGDDAPKGEYVESQKGDELYMYVKPTGVSANVDFDRKLYAAARQTADQVLKDFGDLKVEFTGAFVIRIEEDAVMQKDLQRAGLVASIVALAIILLATRRPVALIVVAAPVSLGIAMTFAFADVTVGHLNPVTGFLGAILIGLGIEYGVHLSMRYWEERQSHSAQEAMNNAMIGTFTGALTSAATNAAAFLVLVFADFDAFRQFGQIAAIGVMSTVFTAYLMGPAILAIAERIRPFKAAPARKSVEEGGTPARAWRVPSPAMVALLAVIASFAIFSVTVAKHASFEQDLKRLKGESPATALDDHITANLGIIMSPALIHVPDLAQAKAVARIVADVRSEGGEKTSIQKAASLNDLVPQDVDDHLAAIEQLRALLTKIPDSMKEGETGEKVKDFVAMLDAKTYSAEQVPMEIRRRFNAMNGGGTFVLLFPRYSGYNTDELDLWAADLDKVLERTRAAKIDARLFDSNRIAAKIFTLVKKDGPFILGSAALVVFVMIWMSLRSLTKAALVAGPLFIGMTCVFGAMFLTGVKLNFLNVVVLPNLLTIAVDNSVHLYHRYKEEGPGSMGHVVRTTGLAAVVATVSNAAGYGALLVAHHEGLRSIALLAILGVSCTFLGTTVFFPAMLELIERWRMTKVVRPAEENV
jgi:predicted RND superfamily exporter protein